MRIMESLGRWKEYRAMSGRVKRCIYQCGKTIEKSKEVITHKSQDGGYFHWGENSAQRVLG